MMTGGQRLPSLDSLRIFEVVARHGSFTAAARELHVTQSAVSQRVVALEGELGIQLFQRTTRQLVLTADGEALAAGVRRGVAEISDAVSSLRQRKSTTLRVSTTPSFATHWLIPRLRLFRKVMPDVAVALSATSELSNLQSGDTDIALRFGLGRYPGLAVEKLMSDAVTPVARPDLLADAEPVRHPLDLLKFQLLVDVSNETEADGAGWSHWFASLGIDLPRLANMEGFNQSSLAIGAAASGLGVALGQLSLAGDDLLRGSLARAWPHDLEISQTYHLVTTKAALRDGPVKAFRDWIIAEAGVFREALAAQAPSGAGAP